MKHAGDADLDRVDKLLQQIRRFEQLSERKRGVFYRKSTAFLHFHQDLAGIFADIRTGDDWQRLPANSTAERKAVLVKVGAVLADKPTAVSINRR